MSGICPTCKRPLPTELLRTDDFTFDPSSGELRFADGRVEKLGPRAAKLLETLMRNPGEILNSEQLQLLVWPDTYCSPGNLYVHIYHLRELVGARIQNVHGRGYRWVD